MQANRAPIAVYFELVEKLPASTELAEREQIIHVLDFINRLLSGSSEQEEFQRYARSLLRPTFDAVGWGNQTGRANGHGKSAGEPDYGARKPQRPENRRELSRTF